ncbi:hypothetical protein VPH35_107909 [Triticum aestivum]
MFTFLRKQPSHLLPSKVCENKKHITSRPARRCSPSPLLLRGRLVVAAGASSATGAPHRILRSRRGSRVRDDLHRHLHAVPLLLSSPISGWDCSGRGEGEGRSRLGEEEGQGGPGNERISGDPPHARHEYCWLQLIRRPGAQKVFER